MIQLVISAAYLIVTLALPLIPLHVAFFSDLHWVWRVPMGIVGLFWAGFVYVSVAVCVKDWITR